MRLLIIALILLAIIFMLFACLSPLGKIVNKDKSKSYFYNKSKSKIIYSLDGNWFEIGHSVVKDADVNSFEPINDYLGKDKNYIFYQSYTQKMVDKESFVATTNGIIKDKQHVYSIDGSDYNNQRFVPIKDADPNTYQKIDYTWAKDAAHYFYYNKPVKVDYPTFKIILPGAFTDKNYLYVEDIVITNTTYNGNTSSEISQEGIAAVDSFIDQNQIKIINQNYLNTAQTLYYVGYANSNQFKNKKEMFTKNTFKIISSIELLNEKTVKINREHIIYYGNKYPINTVDAKSFKALDSALFYFIDKNKVYYENKIIEEADVSSFSLINDSNIKYASGYAKDKNHVYFDGVLVKDANPLTFHYDAKSFFWTDNKHDFLRGEIVK
ncbi:MAG: DKNYY domain-containing protein [Bacteroidetes bacterium]|nr:DKNYY domain-containing protein [Bacteroidota bacterium]